MISAYMRSDFRRMDALNRKMPDIAQEGATQSAQAVIRYINANWSSISPSERGGPPARVTGNLERSARVQGRDISGRFTSGGSESYGATIRYTAIYAGRLELGDLNRPFLGPALAAIAPEMGMMFKNAMRSGMLRA